MSHEEFEDEYERKELGKSKKRTPKRIKLAIVIALAVVITAGICAGIYVRSNQKAKAATEQAKKADPEKTAKRYEDLKVEVTIDADDPMYRQIDFEAAKAMNPDVYAWIWIPGTNIDYPILQSGTEDDAYYLNHTIERLEGLPGSIYTEKYNRTDFSDQVTVVYGHNMKDGSMFADLHKYEDKQFFESNPYVYIYLPGGQTWKYRIFAAVTFDDRYILGNYSFSLIEDFQSYLDELRGSINGNVDMNIEVTQDTGILTLSTCIGDSPNQRWLVNATWEE